MTIIYISIMLRSLYIKRITYIVIPRYASWFIAVYASRVKENPP